MIMDRRDARIADLERAMLLMTDALRDLRSRVAALETPPLPERDVANEGDDARSALSLYTVNPTLSIYSGSRGL